MNAFGTNFGPSESVRRLVQFPDVVLRRIFDLEMPRMGLDGICARKTAFVALVAWVPNLSETCSCWVHIMALSAVGIDADST